MTASDPTSHNTEDLATLIGLLHRKEGTWVQWGQACQQLQKAGETPQSIFEQTGFEPIHQNQITVAAQVYLGLVNANVPTRVLEHFEHRGSDILYELRVLAQTERADVAELVLEKNLDAIATKEVVKAVKDLDLIKKLPKEFTTHPGDAVAYQVWKAAQNKQDLQERVQLVSRGLKFAHSDSAREAIERILTDIATPKQQPAPRLPMYRLDSEDNMPRLIPVAGKLPMAVADLKAVPLVDEVAPFGMVRFAGECAWVTLPGWQVVISADDGVAILCDTDSLQQATGLEIHSNFSDRPEEILILLDRSQRTWDSNSYFAIDQAGELKLQWFPEAPNKPLLGRVVLVMRQKRVLDEEISKDPWQIDE